MAAPAFLVAQRMPALAIATLTIAVNLIAGDVSARAGGKLARKAI